MKKGDTVWVGFFSSAACSQHGTHIHGVAIIDLFEDGYVFGRLVKNNQPFACPVRFAVLHKVI